jgi:isopentenyl diphosphate isomerase/L-lactate dehydrogenase-like FMN-dependent dehydrogenase
VAATAYGRQRQSDIYLAGVRGRTPRVPQNAAALERAAQRSMSKEGFAYIAGGAGLETTMRANRDAFERVEIVPRMLRGPAMRSLEVELFGRTLPAPLLIAPVGVLEMADAEADLAVARAAAAEGVPMIFSGQASKPLEECSAAMGDGPRWFQLYVSTSDDLVRSFVSRAERSGCEAIVVTLDTTMLGWRLRDLDLGYLPFLAGKGIAQYISDPVFQRLVDEAEAPERGAVTPGAIRALWRLARAYPGSTWANLRSPRPRQAVRTFLDVFARASLRWEDLAVVRDATPLPVLLKGILHPEDAVRALDYGVDGIVVSNHGGRQVDGAIASLDALPAVVDAVAGRVPVLLDSGIRGGADAFKALALGAAAVLIGRPYCYGLAVAGEAGVREVVQNFIADFDLTLGLAGCASLHEISAESVVRS